MEPLRPDQSALERYSEFLSPLSREFSRRIDAAETLEAAMTAHLEFSSYMREAWTRAIGTATK